MMGREGDLLLLRTEVELALGKSRAYLTSKIQNIDGNLVFTDQPDDGPAFLGTYGASCAAISLIASGAAQDDPLVRQLLHYLCRYQMDSGGWTIRSASDVGLTTACAFSLIALSDGGTKTEAESTALMKGIEWLVSNARENGWPYFSGAPEIGTTPTAFAVRALSRSKDLLSPSQRRILEHGISCVDKAVSSGFAYGRDPIPNRGSVPVTSLAVISLVQSGVQPFLPQIQACSKWLREQESWSDDNSDSFYAYAAGNRDKAAHVNYVHFTPALLLQSLLASEADIVSEPKVSLLARQLISSQRPAGDWRSTLAVRETPTWMEMDATLGLVHFLKEIDSIKSTLRVRDEVSTLAIALHTTSDRIDTVSSAMEKRIGDLQSEVAKHIGELESEVAHQRMILSPLRLSLATFKVATPVASTLLLIGIYAYLRHHYNPGWTLFGAWEDIFGALGILATVLIGQIYAMRLERKIALIERGRAHDEP